MATKQKADFEAWLNKQVRRDDPVGDLARDRKSDLAGWTSSRWENPDQALSRILRFKPLPEVLAALRTATQEWCAETERPPWFFAADEELRAYRRGWEDAISAAMRRVGEYCGTTDLADEIQREISNLKPEDGDAP